MLFTIESSVHTLLIWFEPLYMNMYLIDLSDGVVLYYTLRLEIYGVDSVIMWNGTVLQRLEIYGVASVIMWNGAVLQTDVM